MSGLDFLVTSRPSLKLDGQDAASLGQGLLTMRVHEHVEGLYSAELQFGNWGLSDDGTDFLFFDRRQLDFGKALEVGVADRTLFKGKIMALEAGFPEGSPPVLTALAEDRLQDLRLTRRTRTFADVSDADAISQIASEHGLSPRIDAPGPTHKVLAQVAQSDLAFVRERTRAIGAEVWVDGSTLNVAPRSSRTSGTPIVLGYGSELREFTVIADLAGQRSSVTVSGWDVAGKTAISESGDDGDLGGEASSGVTGASILASAFAERKESVATVPLTTEEAEARAKAIFLRQARKFVSGRGLAQTDPGLRAGATVRLRGVGPLFEGEYYVSEVTHLFDPAFGLRTELYVERPWLGRPQ